LEKLTPVQRITVIAIGLALTLLVLVLLLPWAWKQISEWLPATPTRSVGPAPAPLPLELTPPAALPPEVALGLAAVLPGGS
jgi:hypothetical protein